MEEKKPIPPSIPSATLSHSLVPLIFPIWCHPPLLLLRDLSHFLKPTPEVQPMSSDPKDSKPPSPPLSSGTANDFVRFRRKKKRGGEKKNPFSGFTRASPSSLVAPIFRFTRKKGRKEGAIMLRDPPPLPPLLPPSETDGLLALLAPILLVRSIDPHRPCVQHQFLLLLLLPIHRRRRAIAKKRAKQRKT